MGLAAVQSQKLSGLGSDSKELIEQTDLSANVAVVYAFHLSFSHHIHRLVACQYPLCRVEREETQSGPSAAFDKAVVLLDQVIEIFDLPQFDRRGKDSSGFEVCNGFGIGRILIDIDDAGS